MTASRYAAKARPRSAGFFRSVTLSSVRNNASPTTPLYSSLLRRSRARPASIDLIKLGSVKNLSSFALSALERRSVRPLDNLNAVPTTGTASSASLLIRRSAIASPPSKKASKKLRSELLIAHSDIAIRSAYRSRVWSAISRSKLRYSIRWLPVESSTCSDSISE